MHGLLTALNTILLNGGKMFFYLKLNAIAVMVETLTNLVIYGGLNL
jgi:hypothetical protein